MLRDSRLDTREARAKLKPRGKPYWRLIEGGLHLGYRRLKGRPGTWVVRRYVGEQSYAIETLKGVVADDFGDADGITIMNFAQAQREALKHKPKTGPMTVRQAMDQYIAYLADSGKATDDARYRADALILPPLGDLEVEALSTERIRQWLSSLAKSPAKRRPTSDERQRRNSANRVAGILKAALNLAFREGHVHSDSAWRRVKPLANASAARLRYLSVAEAQRLINACDPEFRSLVQATLVSGARYGELTRLRAHDFNPDAGTLHIKQSKSGKPRHVVLTDEGRALFSHWCAGKSGNSLLFTRNGEPWGHSNQQYPLQLACERAKIKPTVSFHGLRHTWASLSVMGGMPLMVVAKISVMSTRAWSKNTMAI